MIENIFSTNNEQEALIVKEILEQHGIACFIKNQYTQNLFGDTRFFTGIDPIAGSMEICVNASEVDKALEILDQKFISLTSRNEPALAQEDESKYIQEEDDKESTSFDRSLIGKGLMLSFMSVLISPVFFNIKYLRYMWKNTKSIFVFSMILTVSSLLFSFFAAISSLDYVFIIIGCNVFLLPILCTIKGLSLYSQQPKKIYLIWFAPIILLFSVFILIIVINSIY